MKYTVKLLFLLFLGLSMPVLGMEPVTRIISSLQENIHKPLLDELKKVQKGGEVYSTYYAFTDSKIADALIAAHKRGVRVGVVVDHYGHNKIQKKRLKDAGITVGTFNRNKQFGNSHLHSKSTIIKHANDKKVVFLGSANASVQSNKNSEIVTITESNDSYYQENLDFFVKILERTDDQKPADIFGKKTKRKLQNTPRKMKMVHSGAFDLTMSAFVNRINNTNPSSEKLDIATYSFNDRNFMDAVRRFYRKQGKGRFITERGALKGHASFLDTIARDGALVYLYNPTKCLKSGVSLQHAKVLIRHSEKPLVVVSENNPTTDSYNDAGKAVFHPGDKSIAQKMTEHVNNLVENYCDLYIPQPVDLKRKKSQDEDIDFAALEQALKSNDRREQMRALISMKKLTAQAESELTLNTSTEFLDLYDD